jgi:hypothetical protein
MPESGLRRAAVLTQEGAPAPGRQVHRVPKDQIDGNRLLDPEREGEQLRNLQVDAERGRIHQRLGKL